MCYDELGKHFRVIAPDHRGHGRGIRTTRTFTLEDCADDAAALADQLGINTFIPVGYSMGGTIAQLMWKRHEHRVRGLVLAATSSHFAESPQEKRAFTALSTVSTVARFTPKAARDWISDQLYVSRKTMTWEPWAAQQVAFHDWRQILEAGAALGRFDSRPWLPDVDVPTAVVKTTQDHVVAPARQQAMTDLLPDPFFQEIDADHDAVFARASEFTPMLINACLHVHHRAQKRAAE